MPYLKELFRKYVDGSLTEAERQELYDLLLKDHLSKTGMADEVMREMIDRQFREWSEGESVDPSLGERLFEQLAGRMERSPLDRLSGNPRVEERTQAEHPCGAMVVRRSFRPLFKWLTVAACLLIAAGAAFVVSRRKDSLSRTGEVSFRYRNDVAPGGNRASLTLTDGTVIDLDTTHSGLLTRQGNIVVSKQGNGQLLYAATKALPGSGPSAYAASRFAHPGTVFPLPPADEMNVLTTPRGGQYQVVLPDGTRVLLNAASSLRYPMAFRGKERTVVLTGEAYFEVASDAGKPFLVKAAGMRVQVLGTSFDVMAYDNEAMVRTTLLTGKVKEICQEHDSVMLAPGQQAVLHRGSNRLTREVIDTDEVVAWKEGLFLFSNRVDIPTIMRQLERWYDINVHYEGAVPAQTFYGGIQRSLPLSKVLSILERTGVRFKIEGRDITVLDSSKSNPQ
jgi:transmembrane sensor